MTGYHLSNDENVKKHNIFIVSIFIFKDYGGLNEIYFMYIEDKQIICLMTQKNKREVGNIIRYINYI